MDLSPVVLNQLSQLQKTEIASLLTKVGNLSDLSLEQKALLEALSGQKTNDQLSGEIAGLKSTIQASSGSIGTYKTVSIVPVHSISITASSTPTKITPPSGCRLKITLLSGGSSTPWNAYAVVTSINIKLGNTILVGAWPYNHSLAGVLTEVSNTYRWYGSYYKGTTNINSDQLPLMAISPLGCPVGGVNESLTMTTTVTSAQTVYIAYEVIKDV